MIRKKNPVSKAAASAAACAVLWSCCLPASAAMLEITGTFADANAGKWLTAMVVANDTAAEPSPENIAYITQERINPDGSFTLKLPVMQDAGTLRTNLPINPDTAKYYYVSGKYGSADGTGAADSPVDTLQKAFELASDGDTVVLLDSIPIKSWGTSKSLTVTGRNPITGSVSGGFDLTGTVSLRVTGPTVFENLTFTTRTAETISESANRIFACGNKLVMGEGLTMTEPIDILGGNTNNNSADSTDLTLLSGRYRRIYGGGWNSPVNGDTNVVIGGEVNCGYAVEDNAENYYDSRVYGGGIYSGSQVAGETHITIKDNAAMAYVVGGGVGNGSDVAGGATHINIEGGRVMNVYGATADKTTVFEGNTYIKMTGGSAEGIFGGSMSRDMKGNTYIEISGGQVTRRIFGGCYNDWAFSWGSDFHVDGTTTVWIGKGARLITGDGLSSGNKLNSGIFAASRSAGNAAEERAYLIFADGTYDGMKDKIGDITGWDDEFQSNHDYLVIAGAGGTAVPDSTVSGALRITADDGKTAVCNGIQTENGLYMIESEQTVIEFADTPGLAAKLTDGGAEVSANVALGEAKGGERVTAAIYDSRSKLVSVNTQDYTSNGNYKLTLDFSPEPTESYTIRLFVWKFPELKPMQQSWSFGPINAVQK